MEDNNLIFLVRRNEIAMASPKKPIIGTYALAICMGLIITDNKNYAITHILNDYDSLVSSIVNLFPPGILTAYIIPGPYTTTENLNKLQQLLNNHDIFFKYDFNIKIEKLPEFYNEKYFSIEFGFDTRTNKFIKLDFDKLFAQGENYERN